MEPGTDFERVRADQRRTAVTRDLVAGADLHALPAIDTADLTEAAAIGRTLGSVDLRAIGDALAAAAAAHRAVHESNELRDVCAPYTPLRELQRALVDAIDERGAVLDRASAALGRIRRGLAQAQADARDRVGSIVRSSKYANAIQDSIVTIRDGRFVVPVKAEFSGVLPGIVHDTSSSGQTLFVEPLAALEANNRVRTRRIEEEREVQRILEDLSRKVGAERAAIEANVEMLAAIDLLVAKARVASAMDAIEPALCDEAAIVVERGRHPLLGDRAVAQTLALDDAAHVLVVSGPNMGGKTVALKMVGLFIAMTYCGMQVPAGAGTRVGRFDRVVADIGDEQSIAGNVSSYAAHLMRMREMLEVAGERTLLLVDEIGGGTEPSAGAALAVAMMESWLRCGAHGVVTTHATELKLFAHQTPRVVNASVRFDPQSFAPTYQLDVGSPGQSLAFPLALALGIGAEIVERAQTLLGGQERNYEAALAELSLRNAELQAERDRLSAQTAEVRRQSDALQRERASLEVERRGFAARADERMQQALRNFVNELSVRAESQRAVRPKVRPSQAALLAETLEAMHRDLGIVPPEERASESGDFEPGETVRARSLNQEGVVAEDYGDTLLLAIGPMKTVVKKGDVERVPAAKPKRHAAQSGGTARVAAAARTLADLDVRGRRYVEAEPLVERWLDDALLAGNSPLRLIHGKGTGMLGRGLQEYLRGHPAVKSVRYGNEDEGSAGVTIVELQT